MATLGLLVPAVHAQEQVDAYRRGGAAGGFQDPFNSLSSLSVGPYPSTALRALEPIAIVGAEGLETLNKRQYYCDPGYGLC
ncbi:hypothetical protein BGZ65_007902, partial [Modicella reniformis]